MKILAVECSAGPASAAVAEDGRLLSSAFINVKITHSQTLLSLVKSVLDTAMLKVSDIDAFAIAAGPGSFTGVRIGISLIKGLAEAENKPCYSVSSLRAMAENIYDDGAVINAVMDARCGQFYNALFIRKEGKLERLTEDSALMFEDILSMLSEYREKGYKVITVGDGAELFVSRTDGAKNILLAPEQARYQNAASVALSAYIDKEACPPMSADKLLPVYLRLPQAERELKAKQEESK